MHMLFRVGPAHPAGIAILVFVGTMPRLVMLLSIGHGPFNPTLLNPPLGVGTDGAVQVGSRYPTILVGGTYCPNHSGITTSPPVKNTELGHCAPPYGARRAGSYSLVGSLAIQSASTVLTGNDA